MSYQPKTVETPLPLLIIMRIVGGREKSDLAVLGLSSWSIRSSNTLTIFSSEKFQVALIWYYLPSGPLWLTVAHFYISLPDLSGFLNKHVLIKKKRRICK